MMEAFRQGNDGAQDYRQNCLEATVSECSPTS